MSAMNVPARPSSTSGPYNTLVSRSIVTKITSCLGLGSVYLHYILTHQSLLVSTVINHVILPELGVLLQNPVRGYLQFKTAMRYGMNFE